MLDLENQTESFTLKTVDEASSCECTKEHDKINDMKIKPGSLMEIVGREENE